MNFSDLRQIVEDAGFDAQSYSGWGMHGKRCLSFNLDQGENLIEAILELAVSAETYVQENSDLEFEDVILEFRDGKTDSIGLGEVVYFPNIEWEEDEDESDEDSETEDEE